MWPLLWLAKANVFIKIWIFKFVTTSVASQSLCWSKYTPPPPYVPLLPGSWLLQVSKYLSVDPQHPQVSVTWPQQMLRFDWMSLRAQAMKARSPTTNSRASLPMLIAVFWLHHKSIFVLRVQASKHRHLCQPVIIKRWSESCSSDTFTTWQCTASRLVWFTLTNGLGTLTRYLFILTIYVSPLIYYISLQVLVSSNPTQSIWSRVGC